LTLPSRPGIGAAPTSRDGRMDAQYPKIDPKIREPIEGWRSTLLLKRDVFSTVERGRFRAPGGEVDAVIRRIDAVPWWTRLIAGAFLRREARALMIAGSLGVGPRLLGRGRTFLIRSFLDGVALKIARPSGDLAYFRSAKAALRALHRAGVCHNDLAKEQNWLRGSDGRAYLIDFQLATIFPHRGRLFRIAAYEDLRHLLKHKRKYAPDALTACERRVVARKSLPTRVWMATGKRVYVFVTRGILGVIDAEGSGPRLSQDAPRIKAAIIALAQVRDAAVVAFPNRRGGTGLYAFVEADAAVTESAVSAAVSAAVGQDKAPEFVQLVEAMPRDRDGGVRAELLQLIATNQIDLIAALLSSAEERQTLDRIIAERRNLYDIPETEAALRAHPQVRDVAVVAFADRFTGTGLYAFVEADGALREASLRDAVVAAIGRTKTPRYIQLVQSLPRDSKGKVRTDILRIVAMNQVELIDPLLSSQAERVVVGQIVAHRQNLHDRFVL
jgi:AMP-binding enzyme C-terminal domain